jgi:hypothetical protein
MTVFADDLNPIQQPCFTFDFPPAPALSNTHAIRHGVLRGRRGKPGWADGSDSMKNEHAISASEGSISAGHYNHFRKLFVVVSAE